MVYVEFIIHVNSQRPAIMTGFRIFKAIGKYYSVINCLGDNLVTII